MRLPDTRLLVVERQKIVEYLLNPTHPDNGGKAKFFHLPIHLSNWEGLAP
jgi:hypothetical protein